MSGLPVLLRGERVRALVVGGGLVAARKAAALLESGAAVRLVAAKVSAALRELAAGAGGRLELVERAYESADVGDANLVVAATGDRAVNAQVARDADARGRLVNVADAPDEGSWTGLATHRAGALVVAVSAGGVPDAAQRVRDAIASRFDGRYAAAVERLAALRGETLARHGTATWRAAAAELAGPTFCDDVERGTFDARVERWTAEGAWR